MDAAAAKQTGILWKRGVLWLLLLAPLFFISYNFANTYTAQRDDIGMMVFAWEKHIPLWPWSIVPYWSIDLLYGLSFLLPRSRAEIDRHGLRLLSAQFICILGFLIWPLQFTVTRPELAGGFGAMFDILMGFDKPYNQAPSLHMTLLIVLWVCFAKHTTGVWRWLLHGWFALIGLSVLTTWQHHFIDLPTGVLAGWLCVWLWPDNGPSPLRLCRLTTIPKRWGLALKYLIASLTLMALATELGGTWLWLLWPALSLALVALNYAAIGAQGFQKQSNGQLSKAALWLYGPYLLGAWLNSRAWTRKQPQADEVSDGVYLGRIPSQQQQTAFSAIVDLCAELPIAVKTSGYRALPVLDLTAPDAASCLQAAKAIESLRTAYPGKVLVCCALGYSRSATALAAWLLYSKRCSSTDSALALLRQARPQIVLQQPHLLAIEMMLQLPETTDNQGLDNAY